MSAKDVKFKIDTGSQVTSIPKHVYELLNVPLNETSMTLTAVNGTLFKPVGVIRHTFMHNKHTHTANV